MNNSCRTVPFRMKCSLNAAMTPECLERRELGSPSFDPHARWNHTVPARGRLRASILGGIRARLWRQRSPIPLSPFRSRVG
jgi:hypothetical protein